MHISSLGITCSVQACMYHPVLGLYSPFAEVLAAPCRCEKVIKCRDIPIHHISDMLGLQRCQALPFFHAFSGCDVVSYMMGIGKKTAWNAWVNFPDATTTFTAITQDPASLTLDSLHMRRLSMDYVLRNSGQSYILPHCNYQFHKNSFINWSLF